MARTGAPKRIPGNLLDAAMNHMDKVRIDVYEINPRTRYHFARTMESDTPKDKRMKIDNPHVVDRTWLQFITYPLIGQWAASVIGGALKKSKSNILSACSIPPEVSQKRISDFTSILIKIDNFATASKDCLSPSYG